VILQLLGSLVVLALTAVPGRAYERRVDEQAPRHTERSSFVEYVDLVVTGATTTFLALLLCLLLAGLAELIGWEAIDVGSLLGEPGEYVKVEPWRCVIFGLLAAVVSFAIADLAGKHQIGQIKTDASDDAAAYRNRTIWWETFNNRPKGKSVAISAELSSGLMLSGILRGYTPTEADDRELKVGRVVLRRGNSEPVKASKDEFMLLRESQLNYLLAEYVDTPNGDS
jgi:hypothetical protein